MGMSSSYNSRSDCFKITKFNETLKFYGDLYFWKVLKKNSFFKPLRINMIFCEFKMGGLRNYQLLFRECLKEIKLPL